MSQDFMKLCNVIDIDAMYFYKVSFGKINRLAHKHFSDSCLVWCSSWCLLVFISSFLLAYSMYFLYLLFCTCFLVCSASVVNKRTHYLSFVLLPLPRRSCFTGICLSVCFCLRKITEGNSMKPLLEICLRTRKNWLNAFVCWMMFNLSTVCCRLNMCFCLQVLTMDVNVSSQVAKMKRDLLKLIGVGEFSDTAVWKDPCTSFVIPEVFAVVNRYS